MDRLPRAMALSENLNRDFSKAVATEALIKRLEAHLWLYPKKLRKLTEALLAAIRLLAGPIG